MRSMFKYVGGDLMFAIAAVFGILMFLFIICFAMVVQDRLKRAVALFLTLPVLGFFYFIMVEMMDNIAAIA